ISAAKLARRHRDRGILLNAPEATAIICDAMLDAARAGGSLQQAEAAGYDAVSSDHVLLVVAGRVPEVILEVLMDDGTRLIVLHAPLGPATEDRPGAIRQAERPTPIDPRSRIELEVTNTSRRVVRVSSHSPCAPGNQRLLFRRPLASGHRSPPAL